MNPSPNVSQIVITSDPATIEAIDIALGILEAKLLADLKLAPGTKIIGADARRVYVLRLLLEETAKNVKKGQFKFNIS